jgi:glycosyltransferase involved in cell wall biosynthesis
MRILHLVDRLSERGGAYRHLLGMVEWLAAGHEQLLAFGERSGEGSVPCATVRARGLRSRVRAPIRLDPVAAEFAPDIVHLHTVMNPAVLEWAAGRPAVMTVQDHRLFCPGRGKLTLDERVCRTTMSAEACRACFEQADYFQSMLDLTRERLAAASRLGRLTVLSRYMKDELAGAGVPAERIEVIPPFVHGLDSEALPDGPPCVLFVGRLVWAKGVRDAIEAWRQSGLDLPLVFAGAGPFAIEAQERGFEVLGWLDRVRLARTLRRARAVLLPSRWQEPFGIVGLEALAMGVPVAAYDSGGVREWHPGPEQGLVPWGDVPALAAALRQAVRGRASARAGFEREALMRRLVAAYEAVRH